MGGQIWVNSKVGIGTKVTFTLPVTNLAEPLTQQEIVKLPKAVSTTNIIEEVVNPENLDGLPIVLLIEDNQDVLYYLSTCLNDHYRLIKASNGKEGIDKAIESIPDIIISDVMMPGKTGFEVCEVLKGDSKTSHIPIILLTARAEKKDKIKGYKFGADAYLVKPFDADELLVQVDNLIRSRRHIIDKFSFQHVGNIPNNEYPEKEHNFLNSLDELINQEISNPDLNVEKVCVQLYMSRTQLHRKIKALTGKSITAYVRSYRLKEALILIKKTELTIQQIAFETGFSDSSYFHRSFVKEFNKKPTDFRT
jgi:DNA-binding response OmpR family regulator